MCYNEIVGDDMKKKYIFVILLIVLFFTIAYLVKSNNVKWFDSFVYKIVTLNKSSIMTNFYKFITKFSNEFMILLICFVSFIVFKNKKYGLLIFLNAFLIFLINYILKSIFIRPRPFDLMLIFENGYSFPSGHAMVSLSFYGFIIYLINKLNLDKKTKIFFSILLIILILLIGLSRIYLGVHYPSDVLAGYIISLAYLIIYITIGEKYV